MKTIKTNIGNLFIWLGNLPGREKITIGGLSPGVHYTLMLTHNKRVLDIHKTTELGKNNKKSYEQILEMRLFTFARFLLTFHQANLKLLGEFWFSKNINLGKLKHHNLLLTPFEPDESKAKLFLYYKPAKKLRFVKEIDVQHFSKTLFYPHQILESKENSFWVYSNKNRGLKMQGIIFRLNSTKQTRCFYFVTKKAFRKHMQLLQIEMFNILNGLDFNYKENLILKINQLK